VIVYIVENEVFTDKKIAEAYKVRVNLFKQFGGGHGNACVIKALVDKKSSLSMIREEIVKNIKGWPKNQQEDFLKKNNL
jgi:hypothetical protein